VTRLRLVLSALTLVASAVAATAADNPWGKDAALKSAIKSEERLVRAEAAALGGSGAKGSAATARAAYEKLLTELSDTCLRPRLEALIRGTGVR